MLKIQAVPLLCLLKVIHVFESYCSTYSDRVISRWSDIAVYFSSSSGIAIFSTQPNDYPQYVSAYQTCITL